MSSSRQDHCDKDILNQVVSDWQVTFDAITDPVIILGQDLRVKKANISAQDLLRGKKKSILGESCHSLFLGENEQCQFCPIPLIHKKQRTYTQEIKSKYLGKIFSVSCTPIVINEDIVGYIYTAKDISLQHKLEKQLIQAHKMDAIATLAGGIAHDFNNILGAILGNADLLLYRLPQENDPAEDSLLEITSDEILDHVQSIKRAGLRAKDLVSQILDFSRQSSSKKKVISLTPLVKESCKFLRSSYPATIDLKVQAEDVGKVYADPAQIQQVLMNLCNNATQALAHKTGLIEVALREVTIGQAEKKLYPDLADGNYIALTVRDDGEGIPEEVLQKIFDPFFTTREVGLGSGMGLAVLHGIILAHDGIIDVKSTEGKGTVFTVFLPKIEEDAASGNGGLVTSMPRGNETILFVDDEEEIVTMRVRMLEYLGYKVLPASSPEKALEYFKRGEEVIDLLITDHTMPRMTGLELAREAAKYKKDLPVILCSGYSDAVTSEEAKQAGIKRFLAKPLDTRLLAVAIREILPNNEQE